MLINTRASRSRLRIWVVSFSCFQLRKYLQAVKKTQIIHGASSKNKTLCLCNESWELGESGFLCSVTSRRSKHCPYDEKPLTFIQSKYKSKLSGRSMTGNSIGEKMVCLCPSNVLESQLS